MSRLLRSHKKLYALTRKVYKATHPSPSNFEFAIEVTTYCNMRCRFCTNQELVSNGLRPLKNLSLKELDKTLDFIEAYPKPKGKKITINPTGLGEPFCNPFFMDILRTIKKRDLNLVGFATNGTLMKPNIIDELLSLHLPVICISLRFADQERYAAFSRDDFYNQVVANTLTFLERPRPSNEALHICLFEDEDFPKAQKYWSRFLHPQDRLYLTPRFDMDNLLHRDKIVRINERCKAPSYSLIIDVDGNVYPCCEGLWIPKDDALYMGNIYENDIDSISRNLKRFQNQRVFSRPCSYCPQR